MSYIGKEPVPLVNRIVTEGVFNSPSSQIHVPGGYNPNNIAVYINGYRLDTESYDAIDGFYINLFDEFEADTVYYIEEFRQFNVVELHQLKTSYEDFLTKAQWFGKAIGEIVYLRDDLVGVDEPPTDVDEFRFIKLTAGDAYNDGVLSGESVSGSDPYIDATAQIDSPDSPLNGQTINLINTERRFLRAGESGVTQEDEFKAHTHTETYQDGQTGGSYTEGGYLGTRRTTNTGSTGGDETRPRNIGVTAYMRIW